MQLPLQISFRNMGASDAVEAAIRERAELLERFSDRITSCHVVVEAPHQHQRKGKLYGVRIDITLPGEEIAVTHSGPQDHAHEDVYVAIRDAFNTAARRLEDHARRLRGDVKSHEPPLHGKVVRLIPYEGYGFIETSDGREIYFHKNSVTGAGFDKLQVGAEVRLVVAEGESLEGPQASTVTVTGKHHIVG
ncbi:MAG TPA: HPF/RaiA family ribosome-associated protein [Alphaproteobacteria bacterium]|nr:HPF/RaiA family ribosome-associated protein [Alphaproteobacteria bacterium]